MKNQPISSNGIISLKEGDVLMNISRASEYSGFSKSWFYKKTANLELNFYRPSGKTILFLKSELDAYLMRNRVMSKDEIASKVEE